MGIDSRFIPLGYLQDYFVDKDTGAPLSAGWIYFYEDNARTVLKKIYQLTGTPPNYTYTELPNPSRLSSVGTFQDDSGNDIVPYAFPYDGTPVTTTDTIDLYHIKVYAAGTDDLTPGAFQWSRDAVPNLSEEAPTEEGELTNYVPNGQFLLHNDLPSTDTLAAGEIRSPITDIAQGGWTFERSSGSTAKDLVTFSRFGSATENPTGDPRYAVKVQCQSSSPGDTYKGLRLKFMNVNKFSSTTQYYTLSFAAQSNSGSSSSVDINIIKNYGTGGSTTDRINKRSALVIGTSWDVFNIPFTFGTNETKTIGALNDDYVQIDIAFPTSYIFDLSFTDIVLTPDNVDVQFFPNTPDSQMIRDSMTPPVPDHEGATLGLPVLQGKTGLIYDYSQIGKVFSSERQAQFGELDCDGSQYDYNSYDTDDGIPYKRLGDVLWVNSANIYRFGCGKDYFNTANLASDSQLIINNNTLGLVTSTADGSVATTFTFANTHLGHTDYYCQASTHPGLDLDNASIFIKDTEVGLPTAPDSRTSGFDISIWKMGASGAVKQEVSVHVNVANGAALAANPCKCFSFNTIHTAVDQPYYVWIRVDGAGADPAPGPWTGILVDIKGTDLKDVIAWKIAMALNAFQVSSIITKTGGSTPAGSYFTINSTAHSYYVWYTVDGTGVDPAPSGKTGIKVEILSTDTAPQVASKTQIAMNRKSYAVRDMRGYFLRGSDPTGLVDLSWSRNMFVPGIIGSTMGTSEYDDVYHHAHSYNNVDSTAEGTQGDGLHEVGATKKYYAAGTTGYTGGTESRSINQSIYYVVKY